MDEKKGGGGSPAVAADVIGPRTYGIYLGPQSGCPLVQGPEGDAQSSSELFSTTALKERKSWKRIHQGSSQVGNTLPEKEKKNTNFRRHTAINHK